jgi:hypothetical protein
MKGTTMNARDDCLDLLKRLGIDDVGRFSPKHVIVNAWQLKLLLGSLLSYYPSDRRAGLFEYLQKKAPRKEDRCGDDPILSLLRRKEEPKFEQEYLCAPPPDPPCDHFVMGNKGLCLNCGYERKYHEPK